MTREPLKLARIWYGIGVMLLLLVAVLSLVPLSPGSVPVGDKQTHLATYFVLAGWFSLLVGTRTGLACAIAGLLLFGGALEGLQALTGYRYAEWNDLLANAAGVLLGAGLYFTPLTRLLRYLDTRLALLFVG